MIQIEKINALSKALDPMASCDFYDPLEILLWGYCINRGMFLYKCPMVERLSFYLREKNELKIQVPVWELRQEVDKLNIKHDEIRRSFTYNATYHNWISHVKRPTIETDFNNIISKLTLTNP